MGKDVVIIFEEDGCPEAAVDKLSELKAAGPISEINLLKVIDHPPMQWCEHGGAGSGEREHELDRANSIKRAEWVTEQKKLHEKEMEKAVINLQQLGLDNIKVRFVEKEISFSNTVVNELNEGGYRLAIMSEKSWDAVEGKKIGSGISILTL